MGAGHGHGVAGPSTLRIARWARIAVLGLIALSVLAAAVGVLRWWPDSARVHRLQGSVAVVADGVTTVHATLGTVRTACTGASGSSTSGSTSAGSTSCGATAATVLDGRYAGRTVPISIPPDVAQTHLQRGDHVLLLDLSKAAGSTGPTFEFSRADRGGSMLWLALLFAVVVVLVARRRGLMALVSLGFAAAVVIGFLIPALLSGAPPVPVTLSAAALILVVMLYATHGVSMRTSVALVGALLGLGMSAALAWSGVIGARLAGVGDDSAELLISSAPSIDVQQLVIASVIVAGLGTLNDVTVTQASALWELREASPTIAGRDLFRRAVRIGRDHVASSVYTLMFAYLGTALVLLVAVQLYRGSPLDFVTAESVAEEVVRALVGGIALVLAMPITTALATAVVARTASAGPAGSGKHGPRRSGIPHHAAPARAPVPSDPLRSFPRDPWDVDD